MKNNIKPSPLCSIATVLKQERQTDALFAFGNAGNKTWINFISDVDSFVKFFNTKPKARWAICIQDSYWFSVIFFALSSAKKELILPGNQQPEAIRELSSEFDVLIHDNAIFSSQSISLQNTDVVNLESISLTSVVESTLSTALILNDVNVTLFTSGTSGKPKAIKKTLFHFNHEITQLEQIWGSELANCRIQSTVSHQHIYGLLFRLLWPICTQRPFARENLDYPEQVISHADKNSILVSSPALLKRLDPETTCCKYNTVFSSGGPLSLKAAGQTLALFEVLPYEVFGSTETGGIGYRQQHKESTPWQLFPDVKAKLNAEGCIALRSGHIDPENWYQTTDQCELFDDGSFLLKGRTDRIIKIEEKRVSLAEVENSLQKLEWIEESAVIALETAMRLELVAVITLNDYGRQQLSATSRGQFWIKIRNSLRQWLEPIAIPRRYRILDDIPLNSQGKRLVKEIEALFQSNPN
ncbi:AMP-binding protein [Vibrio algarum]|uniref:AMP-binding protein n=1 Tax=Vibrio algarum TaxID=3020714 RepID=A0ABT4YNY3_9VIBR|nr:AMP-binding protein [Vibrio sp. KJ40-1]MDB1123262.1 AMP-binding protein [Vibrio sp. KJ40-1]